MTAPSSVINTNYNLGICAGCGCRINRGDEITRTEEAKGMQLRARSFKNGGGFIPHTGARWVHKLCCPVHVTPDGNRIQYWTTYSGEEYAKNFNNLA